MHDLMRGIWRKMPDFVRHSSLTRTLAANVQMAFLEMRMRSHGFRPNREKPPIKGPVVIGGFFRSASGIGEAARACYRALNAAGLSPLAVDLTEAITRVDLTPDIPLSKFPDDRSGTLLLYVNPPELLSAVAQLGFLKGRRWRIIGCWMWELSIFPREWHRAFKYVSEIWAPSIYCKSSLQSRPDAPPVHVIPVPVTAQGEIGADRARFGIPPNCFTALTMADTYSSFSRKNPVAAIHAFRAAFKDRMDARLIIKTRNLDQAPAARKLLDDAIGGAANIEILDATLSEAERLILIKSVDAVLSLHRAEGFGLVPAEAMLMGTPVIATGWSGNLDFMNAESSLLVGYRLTAVHDPFGIYRNDAAQWAEPDIEHAAKLLSRLAADPEGAAAAGRVGQRQIIETCGARQVGERMAKLLTAPSAE